MKRWRVFRALIGYGMTCRRESERLARAQQGALAAQLVPPRLLGKLCKPVGVLGRQHRRKCASLGEPDLRADGSFLGFHGSELDRVEHGHVYHAGSGTERGACWIAPIPPVSLCASMHSDKCHLLIRA